MDVAVQGSGGKILTPMFQNLPEITPYALKAGFHAVKLQYGTLMPDEVVRTPWAIHFRDAIDLMPVYDMEFAFPINIYNPIKAVMAIKKCVQITAEWARDGTLMHR